MGGRGAAPEARRVAVATSDPQSSPPSVRPVHPGAGGRVAQACDALLTFCVLAFAWWTFAYHACVVAGLGSGWALAVFAAALVPCGLLAVRHEAGDAGRRSAGAAVRPSAGRAPMRLALVATGLAVAAAGSLAWAGPSWTIAWAPWPVAALAVLVAGARGPLVAPGPRVGASASTALAWAAAMALLALLLVKPNSDDAYYLRQAAWIGEHGRFPLGDTLHSHD